MRSTIMVAITGCCLVAGGLVAAGPAAGSSPDAARSVQQEDAHRVYQRFPQSLVAQLAGHWFDPATGKLAVAVTNQEAAGQARELGAEATLVARDRATLDRMVAEVRGHAGTGVPGLNSFGVDVLHNDVVVTVNRTRKNADTERFLAAIGKPGVRVVEVDTSPVQQSGEVNPGDPWWPGGEGNCSVGFGATDASGGRHFVTAGHCTNDANQPAYGESLQRNRIGTSNVGGSRSVNAREGDLGVVAVTEPGWTLSAAVNTWGRPPITVSGSREALVGEEVCHTGNTAPNFECGTVNSVNQTVDYGGGIIIEGLTLTTACSQGGDSGGAWLSDNKAVGLHSGGVSSCSPGQSGNNSIFQPVNEALTKWGLTLVTGDPSDTEPPTAPGNPRSTGSTASSVSLAWDASSDNVGVTGYDVYNGQSRATSVTGTSATVTGLAADTEYTFSVRARDGAGNLSEPSKEVTARTQPGGGGDRTLTNETDFPIRDFTSTRSPIASTLTGTAARTVTLAITIEHTCAQDLGISLFDPRGRQYAVKYSGGYPCTAWTGARTFTVNNVGSPAAGTWTLRVTDYGPDDTGILDRWSITL